MPPKKQPKTNVIKTILLIALIAGAGYFERATVKPNYEISLDSAMLDIDSYGIGAVFGASEWNWR